MHLIKTKACRVTLHLSLQTCDVRSAELKLRSIPRPSYCTLWLKSLLQVCASTTKEEEQLLQCRKLRPTFGTETEQSFTLIRDVERFASDPGATERCPGAASKLNVFAGCNGYAHLECQKCSTPKRPSQTLLRRIAPPQSAQGLGTYIP